MTADTIDEFWLALQKEAPSLARHVADGNMRAAFDRVEGLLGWYGFEFSFDITETRAGGSVGCCRDFPGSFDR